MIRADTVIFYWSFFFFRPFFARVAWELLNKNGLNKAKIWSRYVLECIHESYLSCISKAASSNRPGENGKVKSAGRPRPSFVPQACMANSENVKTKGEFPWAFLTFTRKRRERRETGYIQFEDSERKLWETGSYCSWKAMHETLYSFAWNGIIFTELSSNERNSARPGKIKKSFSYALSLLICLNKS